MTKTATLIYDTPTHNPDLMWATHFEAPDPVLFFDIRGTSHLLLSSLEVDRGRATATADHVEHLTAYRPTANAKRATLADIAYTFCKKHGITQLRVHHTQSIGIVDALRKKRLKVSICEEALFPKRMLKSTQEYRTMLKAQKTTLKAIGEVERMLRESRIDGKKLMWKSEVLTSERIRGEIGVWLLRQGYITPTEMIIAGGIQGTDPHHRGSGPLRPHESIIVDIFPQDAKTFYFGDATRTFCKGKAPAALKKMYNVVKKAQVQALKEIRHGINGKAIDTAIKKRFAVAGYKTGKVDGYMQGFFHGTGHGIGLALHEEPVRICAQSFPLKAGHMVTVEPGLYYRDIGAVRIEDTVYVTKEGCKVLGSYPKKLEIA